MGQITVTLFAGLALIALALIAIGAFRRMRAPAVLGVALLLSLAGAWMLGFLGILAGVFVLPLARTRSAQSQTRT